MYNPKKYELVNSKKVVITDPGEMNFKFLPWIEPKKYREEKTSKEKPTKKIYFKKYNNNESRKLSFWMSKSSIIEREVAISIINTKINPTKTAYIYCLKKLLVNSTW